MLISEYEAFVRGADQSISKGATNRREIAAYGLVGEIGSLFTAVKKSMLADDDAGSVTPLRHEIREELGDVLWYCISLSHAVNVDTPVNVFNLDIRNLRAEIGADDVRAQRIGAVLGPELRVAFLHDADRFISDANPQMDAYQTLAFKTARTEGRVLRGVCLTVLWQLGAEVLRPGLPDIEMILNKSVVDRDLNTVLGEIVWHVAALATLHNLKLSEIAGFNVHKIGQRYGRGMPTPLHDRTYPEHERFPRYFEVSFVTVGRGRSRMYLAGKQLGNELTDNTEGEDGYRFHDVMHLANVAILGWSPVIRKLVGRKRKSVPKVDEVQDGARAQIVEELIIKSIHSEGLAQFDAPDASPKTAPRRLFPERSAISFRLLNYLGRLGVGLEVESSKLWEWEDAILAGCEMFQALRNEGQGTIALDLDNRSIKFRPEVYVDLPGTIVGVGTSHADAINRRPENEARLSLVRIAILNALQMDCDALSATKMLAVTAIDGQRVSVRASGVVQEAIWATRTVSFRIAWAEFSEGTVCTAYAMSDPQDASL